jgi:hypothetical protein
MNRLLITDISGLTHENFDQVPEDAGVMEWWERSEGMGIGAIFVPHRGVPEVGEVSPRQFEN